MNFFHENEFRQLILPFVKVEKKTCFGRKNSEFADSGLVVWSDEQVINIVENVYVL